MLEDNEFLSRVTPYLTVGLSLLALLFLVYKIVRTLLAEHRFVSLLVRDNFFGHHRKAKDIIHLNEKVLSKLYLEIAKEAEKLNEDDKKVVLKTLAGDTLEARRNYLAKLVLMTQERKKHLHEDQMPELVN